MEEKEVNIKKKRNLSQLLLEVREQLALLDITIAEVKKDINYLLQYISKNQGDVEKLKEKIYSLEARMDERERSINRSFTYISLFVTILSILINLIFSLLRVRV